MRRSGMDYLEHVKLTVHDNLAAFREFLGAQPYWLLSARAERSIWDAPLTEAQWIILGRETAGLPHEWLSEVPERCLTIPMLPDARCINLANSAGIALYESLRQNQTK